MIQEVYFIWQAKTLSVTRSEQVKKGRVIISLCKKDTCTNYTSTGYLEQKNLWWYSAASIIHSYYYDFYLKN